MPIFVFKRKLFMKTLYLFRHAKSSWDFPDLDDADRPLNERGLLDAPFMGQKLASFGVRPSLLVSSPANRAKSTAHLVAKALGHTKNIVMDKRIYATSPDGLLGVVQTLPEGEISVMLFGHNPEFTEFANLLADLEFDDIPTAGVVGLSLQVDTWDKVSWGCGRMLFFHFPKSKF